MIKHVRLIVLLALLLSPVFSFGQNVTVSNTGCPGVPGACGYHPNNPSARTGPVYSPQNGNGTLGVIYDQAKCGLDFASASQRLGKRFTPAGVNQPAPFVISGIPACAVIEKAYLWAEGSGNGAAQTATVNGPLGSANYPMTIVGTGPDKCWGYSGTYTYRADVTASVNGNGTYNISGLLTNPPTSGNDMDGATLVVIWSQASANWQGRIVIADGAYVVNGGVANYVMPLSPAVCGATTNARAFMCVGDIQFNPSSWSLNGTAAPLTWNWWDYVQVNTTVAAAQANSTFNVNTGGDCFNLCVSGLYFRTTTCATCPSTTALTTNITSTPANCSACNGTASVTVTPSGSYTYSWSPAPGSGGNTANPSNMCAGNYTVTITSACATVTATVNVATSGGSVTTTGTQTNVSCNGSCDGSASVTVTSGTAPYTYVWAPAPGGGQGSPNATGLCAGTYTCTVTDATNCTGTQIFTITQPPAITYTTSQVNVLCNGQCTGSASLVPSGGSGSFTYNWSPAPGGGQGTANPTGLCAGTYSCTIADASVPTCTVVATVTITQPTALTATTSSNPAICGNSNGSATVTPSGGAGGYTYNWAPVSGSLATLSNIPQGAYTCTIGDANGCSITVTVNVGSAGSPSLTITSVTDVTCFGACNGAIDMTGSGGTGVYTYNWIPAPGAGQGTPNASSLCPGSYSLTITDSNGCTATETATITEPPQLTATAAQQTDVTCFAACNGSASVNAGGGNGTLTYNWSPAPGAGQGTATATNMCAGSYTCTVSDANNCSTTVTFTITEPQQLTVAAAGFNVTCFGACDGQIVSIPAGGTPNYTFSWSTGCTTASCNNICAGSYTVIVTDANGCTATSTATVTEPPAITITTSTVDANCNQSDGSASAVYAGGTGTLNPVWYSPASPGATYSNIPAGNYYVVVTDANGCEDTAYATVNNLPGVVATPGTVTDVSCFGGNDGALTVTDNGVNAPYTYAWTCSASATNTASNLTAGNCSVTLTDTAGCTSTATFTITEPQQLTVTATATPGSVCAGQNIQLSGTGNGGTPAYQYAWAPGPLIGQNQTITPAASGTYTVYITDAHNCVDSSSVSIVVNDIPAAALSGDLLSGCAPLCVNFSDLSTISSGTITQWDWDFGDGNTSTLQTPTHCYLTPGVYSVTLTVATGIGCMNTITMNNYVNVFPNPVADFSASPQPTTELNPTIYFTDLSTGASSWNWNFGDLSNASSSDQNPFFMYPGPGCFDVTLTVETNNGCVDTTVHQVCIDPDVSLFVPNAFTPNGDGINETFFPKGIGLDPDHFEMWVFDRWGNLIFYTDDINKAWDGTVQNKGGDLCQEDVYVWKIKTLDLLGKKHNLIGHVSLIR